MKNSKLILTARSRDGSRDKIKIKSKFLSLPLAVRISLLFFHLLFPVSLLPKSHFHSHFLFDSQPQCNKSHFPSGKKKRQTWVSILLVQGLLLQQGLSLFTNHLQLQPDATLCIKNVFITFMQPFVLQFDSQVN